MTTRSRLSMGPGLRVSLGALMLAVVVAGCSPVSPSSPDDSGSVPGRTGLGAVVPALGGSDEATAGAAITAVLTKRARAVVSGGGAEYLATSDLTDPRVQRVQATAWRRISATPIRAWSYDVVSHTSMPPLADGDQRESSEVRLHYRLGVSDVADSVASEHLTWSRRAGQWLIDSESATDSPLLWEVGEISARRVGGVQVIGVGSVHTAELVDTGTREVAALGQVAHFLRRPVAAGAVVVVPSDESSLARLLGRTVASVKQIAAVTMTGTGDGKPGADRIWINRTPFDGLSGVGRDIVLRHESTHLALAAASSNATPLWLEEGMAELVGYRGSGVPLDVAAADVLEPVADARLPIQLPDTAAFTGTNPALGSAYHQAWTACLWLAERLGEQGLVSLYELTAAGRAADPESNADVALAHFGLTRASLVAGWRAALMHWADNSVANGTTD